MAFLASTEHEVDEARHISDAGYRYQTELEGCHTDIRRVHYISCFGFTDPD